MRFEAKKNGERGVRFPRFEESVGPGKFHEDRSGGGQQNEIVPAFAQRDCGDANIQDRDVAKERGRIIDAGRKQHRGEKSAKQTEHDDHLRVHANREEEGGSGDERHGSEGGDERDQVIENVSRENVAVENEDAGGAETLSRDAITPRGGEPADDDEAETEHGADRHAHGGRDEIVLERILHQKDDPEEKDEAADPGEKFNAKERFPIDRLGRRRWRRGRAKGGGTGGGGGGGGGFAAAARRDGGLWTNGGGGGGGARRAARMVGRLLRAAAGEGGKEEGPERDSRSPTRATRCRTADLVCGLDDSDDQEDKGDKKTTSPRQTTGFPSAPHNPVGNR